jgi:hypothetical protein
MDENILKNWNKIKGHLKRSYPMLTNADVALHAGKNDEMFENIMFKTKQSKEELTTFMTGITAM